MTKAAEIAYYALTTTLDSASQYTDSREATITAAIILYGECSIEHQATENAWHAVGVGNENDCSYTLSIDKKITSDAVSVYPNPAKDKITVELPYITNKPVLISDISGKIIKEFSTDQVYFKQDISELSEGVYYIHFMINGNHIVKKLIIQL